jgi:hypothetical protein
MEGRAVLNGTEGPALCRRLAGLECEGSTSLCYSEAGLASPEAVFAEGSVVAFLPVLAPPA